MQLVLVYANETAEEFQHDRDHLMGKLRELDPDVLVQELPIGKVLKVGTPYCRAESRGSLDNHLQLKGIFKFQPYQGTVKTLLCDSEKSCKKF